MRARSPSRRSGAAAAAPAVGVPSRESRRFFGDAAQEAAFDATVAAAGGARARASCEVDFAPFFAVAAMLYEGAWVAERHVVVGPLLARDPEAVHPVIRPIVEPARGALRGRRRLPRRSTASRRCGARWRRCWRGLDLLCVPTFPTFVTLEEIAADPIGPNARLGTYTNFVNLLGLCGLAVPTPARSDGRPGSVDAAGAGGARRTAREPRARDRAGGERRLGATGWTVPAAGGTAAGIRGGRDRDRRLRRPHVGPAAQRGADARSAAASCARCGPSPSIASTRLAGGPPRRPGHGAGRGRRRHRGRGLGAAQGGVRRLHRRRAGAALDRHGRARRRHDAQGLPLRARRRLPAPRTSPPSATGARSSRKRWHDPRLRPRG